MKSGAGGRKVINRLDIGLATLLLFAWCSTTAYAQGEMVNGALYQGNIAITKQVDTWSFTANAGDSVVVRVGQLTSTNYFGPWLRVYGPDGTLLGQGDTAGAVGEEVALTATNSGTYTVVVSDGSYPAGGYGGTGTYQLNYLGWPGNFVVSPGDQGGPMTNGAAVYTGTITIGDLDPWLFTACTGDSINLTLLTTNFNGYLQLYGPNGALLKSIGNSTVSSLTYTATNCGTYTAVVSAYSTGGTGTYGFTANGLEDELKGCPPGISGTNLTLNGVGGSPGATVILYSTTNVATPFGGWTPVLTNQFDQYGVFGYTNLYDPAQRQQYFRFLVP